MKYTPVTLCLTVLPGMACAAGGDSGEFSLAASLLQMVASLALVIGVILLFYYVSSRWLKKMPGGSATGRYIRVVETRHLTPKKSLIIVEVGGEYLLLSSQGEGLQLIKQVDLVEDIEVVEERMNLMQLPALVRGKFSSAMAGVPGEFSRCLAMKKSGEMP